MSDSKDVKDGPERRDQIQVPENAVIFGQMMRAAREVAGYSVDELSQTTRIAKAFILALESGSFEKFPGDVFARGFIRNICKALGEDNAHYLEAFAVASGENPQQNEQIVVKPETRASSIELRSEQTEVLREWLAKIRMKALNLPNIHLRMWGLAAAVALMIPAIFWLAGRPAATSDLTLEAVETPEVAATSHVKEASPEEITTKILRVESEENSLAGVESKTATSADDVSSVEPAAAETSSEGASQLALKQAAGVLGGENVGQVVDLEVKNKVDMRVKLDAGPWKRKSYTEGNYRLYFDDQANLLVFDAAALNIRFNGKQLGYLGQKGRVRRLSFKSGSAELNKNEKGF